MGKIMNADQYQPVDAHVKNRFPLFYRVSSYFRRKRMKCFLEELEIRGNEKILDVGGEFYFWEPLTYIRDVTLLNLHRSGENERIKSIEYGGTFFPFKDGAFDIVFSNSTIEHVGDLNSQKLFASEVRRVARKYFIQVPSYWFFYEPHAQIPFFQFLSERLKRLARRLITKSPYTIEELLQIRLLKKTDIKLMFPDSKIITERFLFMPKSYFIIGK